MDQHLSTAVIIMFINAQDLSCVACATAHLGLSLVIHEFGWVDDICSAALSLSVILLATFEAVPFLGGSRRFSALWSAVPGLAAVCILLLVVMESLGGRLWWSCRSACPSPFEPPLVEHCYHVLVSVIR